MAQALGVGFPAGCSQLLVDQDARQLFIRRKLAAGLAGAFGQLSGWLLAGELLLQRVQLGLEFLARLPQRRFMRQCQRLETTGLGIHLQCQHRVLFLILRDQRGEFLMAVACFGGAAQFGLQLADPGLQLAQFRAGVWRRHERTGLEGGALRTHRLVVPDRQRAGDFEAIHCILVPGVKLVHSLVALDAQGMEKLADFRFELDFALKFVQQVGLSGVAVETDAGARSQILRQRFAQLAQLDQGGTKFPKNN